MKKINWIKIMRVIIEYVLRYVRDCFRNLSVKSSKSSRTFWADHSQPAGLQFKGSTLCSSFRTQCVFVSGGSGVCEGLRTELTEISFDFFTY